MLKKRYEALRCIPFSEHVINMRFKTFPPAITSTRFDSHVSDAGDKVQYVTAEWEPAFLRQASEFLFFPLLPREASK